MFKDFVVELDLAGWQVLLSCFMKSLSKNTCSLIKCIPYTVAMKKSGDFDILHEIVSDTSRKS